MRSMSDAFGAVSERGGGSCQGVDGLGGSAMSQCKGGARGQGEGGGAGKGTNGGDGTRGSWASVVKRGKGAAAGTDLQSFLCFNALQ